MNNDITARERIIEILEAMRDLLVYKNLRIEAYKNDYICMEIIL